MKMTYPAGWEQQSDKLAEVSDKDYTQRVKREKAEARRIVKHERERIAALPLAVRTRTRPTTAKKPSALKQAREEIERLRQENTRLKTQLKQKGVPV